MKPAGNAVLLFSRAHSIFLFFLLLLPTPSFGMEQVGALIERHDPSGEKTALTFMLACQNGDSTSATNIVKALLPFVSSEVKELGLTVASQNNREAIVALLLSQPGANPDCAVSGINPLRQASQNGYLGIVQVLAEAKADIEKLDAQNSSPVHAASANGHADIVQFFIEQGAKKTITAKTNKGSTPLHLACAGGHEAVIKLLLPHLTPADIDAVDNTGNTAFVGAILGEKPRCAHLLVAAKADLITRNKKGFLPLDAAVQKSELADLVADLLEAHPETANARNVQNITPLHLAVAHGNLGAALLLLMNKADISLKAADGKTPLDLADADMKKRISKYMQQPNPIQAMRMGAATDMVERLYGRQERASAADPESEKEEEEDNPADREGVEHAEQKE